MKKTKRTEVYKGSGLFEFLDENETIRYEVDDKGFVWSPSLERLICKAFGWEVPVRPKYIKGLRKTFKKASDDKLIEFLQKWSEGI